MYVSGKNKGHATHRGLVILEAICFQCKRRNVTEKNTVANQDERKNLQISQLRSRVEYPAKKGGDRCIFARAGKLVACGGDACSTVKHLVSQSEAD